MPDRKVRDPITKAHLPEAGAQVVEDSYWVRRIQAGDVVVVSMPEKSEPRPKKGAPERKE